MFETIQFEKKNKVAVITLDRPDQLNSFTAQMNKELLKAFKTVSKDHEVRAVLLTGSGRAFCAGQDLADVQSDEEANFGDYLRQRYNPLIEAMAQLEKPIVASVNGAAAGAGFSLALACDFRVVSTKATFMEAFIHIGLVPDSGSCYFLPRYVGWGKAMELAVLGEKISAKKADELGLVTKLAEPESVMEEAMELATRLANMPTKGIGLIKKTMLKGLSSSLEETLELEAYAQELAGKTHDYNEGVAAFIEKRKPKFEGK